MTAVDDLLLQAYVDGELDPAEADRVEALIERSPAWAARAEVLAALAAECARALAVVDDDDPALGRDPTAPGPALGPALVVERGRALTARAPSASRRSWGLRAAAVVVVVGGAASFVGRALRRSSPVSITEANSGTPVAAVEGVTGERDSTARGVLPSVPPSTTLPLSRGRGTTASGVPRRPPGLPTSPPAVVPAPALVIAGAQLLATSVDTVLDVLIQRSTFEVQPGIVVTLETTPLAESDALRAGAPVGRHTTDDSARAEPADDGSLSLTWRDGPRGMLVRLRGPVDEAELRALRRRVRPRAEK